MSFEIDALPTYEEIEAKIEEFEAAGDYEGEEAWLTGLYQWVSNVYWLYYLPLADDLKPYVINADKLLVDLGSMIISTTAATTNGYLDIYQANSYDVNNETSNTAALTITGGTVGEVVTGIDFSWWEAIIVERNDDGYLYVAQHLPSGEGLSKLDYKATTSDGFIALLHSSKGAINAQVGDYVYVDYDYKATTAYTGSVIGQLKFYQWHESGNRPDVVQGADTSELIEVNLYDYGSNINDPYKNTSTEYPGFQQDMGTLSIGTSISKYSLNFGNNIVEELELDQYGSVTNSGGAINATTNGANSPISGVLKPTLSSNGYPVLANGIELEYLFHGNSGYATKKNTGNINGLFQHNAETGEYIFDSRMNHAEFNGTNKFILYDALLSANFIMYPFGNFLPFNKILDQTTPANEINRDYFLTVADRAAFKYSNGREDDYNTLSTVLNKFVTLMDSEYGSTGWTGKTAMQKYASLQGWNFDSAPLSSVYSIDYDYPTDFFFGMEMRMHFMQPKGGMTGTNNAHPMVFYFAGDDDVWIYIDDVLFLDLSGIHRHVGGEIDFVKGVVKYYDFESYVDGAVGSSPVKTVTFAQILSAAGKDTSGLNSKGTFADYSTHKFDFFYMERGAGSSVCRINFNFPMLKKNSISVMKELTGDLVDAEVLGDPDYKFQILKANGTDLFIGADVEYTVYDRSNKKIKTAKTDENGILTLKADQRAEFTGINENSGQYYVRELLDGNVLTQYGKVTVSGETITTYENVEVGGESFAGVNSPVKDISDGTTVFNFVNNFDVNELGSLAITKTLTTIDGTTPQTKYGFFVTLDGKPLPTGTAYIITSIGEDGTVSKTSATSGDNGLIAIGAGETATIENILAGTQYAVKESVSNEYTMEWINATGEVNAQYTISGEIVTDSSESTKTAVATAHNIQLGAKLPVTKTILNPDELDHTFSFELVPANADGSPITDGEKQTIQITVPAQPPEVPTEQGFTLFYTTEDVGKTYYYVISEVTDESSRANDTKYFVEVVITRNQTTGLITATPTYGKLTYDEHGELVRGENGKPVTEAAEGIVYENLLVGDLTLRKEVVGVHDGTKFAFELLLEGENLPGTYHATEFYANGTSQDFELIIEEGAITKKFVSINLAHGEYLLFCGLPIGTEWTITEVLTEEQTGVYVPSCTYGEITAAGNTVTGEIEAGGADVTVTNTQLFELPLTGGPGTHLYTLGGLLLIAASLLLYSIKLRRKEGSHWII